MPNYLAERIESGTQGWQVCIPATQSRNSCKELTLLLPHFLFYSFTSSFLHLDTAVITRLVSKEVLGSSHVTFKWVDNNSLQWHHGGHFHKKTILPPKGVRQHSTPQRSKRLYTSFAHLHSAVNPGLPGRACAY